MAFQNEILAGTALVRNAIKSENYIPGVSGWSINRDGTAEFSGATIRGSLLVGTPPSPPNPYIEAGVFGGIPVIRIFDGVHTDAARIGGFDLGGYGGMVAETGNATEIASLALGGTFGELLYFEQGAPPNDLFARVTVGVPFTSAVEMKTTGGGSRDLAVGLDAVNPGPDAIAGRIYTSGDILMEASQADASYPTRVVDGKGPQATTSTVIGLVDTAVTAANLINTPLVDGYAYRCMVHVDMRNANVGGRLDFKLWAGAVGGTQLGATNRRWTDNSGAGANNGGTVLYFIWRQVGSTTVANINLSAIKTAVTAAAAAVEVNNAYAAIVEKIGNANQISGL